MSANDIRSASRRTGTTSPSSAPTAIADVVVALEDDLVALDFGVQAWKRAERADGGLHEEGGDAEADAVPLLERLLPRARAAPSPRVMSTSLKVVSIAAVRCASTRRLAIVARRLDIRTRSSGRSVAGAALGAALGRRYGCRSRWRRGRRRRCGIWFTCTRGSAGGSFFRAPSTSLSRHPSAVAGALDCRDIDVVLRPRAFRADGVERVLSGSRVSVSGRAVCGSGSVFFASSGFCSTAAGRCGGAAAPLCFLWGSQALPLLR